MQTREYEQLYATEDEHWWFRALRLFVGTLLGPRPGADAWALDVGCGTGALGAQLKDWGYQFTGLDYSRDGLAFARQRGLARLVSGSANQLPFKESFDLITCIDVLEVDAVTPAEAMASIRTALKPGGRALVLAAAFQWLYSQHDLAVNSIHRFSRAELADLARASGLRVRRASYLFAFLFPLTATWKLIKRAVPGGFDEAGPSDVSSPPPLVNTLLYWICRVENWLLGYVNLPFGTSVVVLVERAA